MVLVGRISHRIVLSRLFFEIEIFSKPRRRILERRNGTLTFVVEIRGGHSQLGTLRKCSQRSDSRDEGFWKKPSVANTD